MAKRRNDPPDEPAQVEGAWAEQALVPATTIEAAVGYDLMRSALTALVAHAPGRRIEIDEAFRAPALGKFMRVSLTQSGSIVLQLSDVPAGTRRAGTVYTFVDTEQPEAE